MHKKSWDTASLGTCRGKSNSTYMNLKGRPAAEESNPSCHLEAPCFGIHPPAAMPEHEAQMPLNEASRLE